MWWVYSHGRLYIRSLYTLGISWLNAAIATENTLSDPQGIKMVIQIENRKWKVFPRARGRRRESGRKHWPFHTGRRQG